MFASSYAEYSGVKKKSRGAMGEEGGPNSEGSIIRIVDRIKFVITMFETV